MRKPVRVKPGPDGMNRLERAYCRHLEMRRLAGEIIGWRFEAITFRMAFRQTYTPDFEVTKPDGTLEYHEVKGRWMEDARVKLKQVATDFSDRRFIAVTYPKKIWTFEALPPKRGPAPGRTTPERKS